MLTVYDNLFATRTLYLQRAPVRVVLAALSAEQENCYSLTCQDRIVSDIFEHERSLINHEYRSSLVRKYIRDCSEVAERITAYIDPCTADAQTDVIGTWITVHAWDIFFLTIPLRVGPQFKNVGMSLWPSAFALVDFLMNELRQPYTNFFSNCDGDIRILELGAGTGLTGCFIEALRQHAAMLPEVIQKNLAMLSQVILTDGQKEVVDNCESNLRCIHSAVESGVSRVTLLDWNETEINRNFFSKNRPNRIVAADVIYDADSIGSLVTTIVDALQSNPAGYCIIFATQRNIETTAIFFRALSPYCIIESVPYTIQDHTSSFASKAVIEAVRQFQGAFRLCGTFWLNFPDLLYRYKIILKPQK